MENLEKIADQFARPIKPEFVDVEVKVKMRAFKGLALFLKQEMGKGTTDKGETFSICANATTGAPIITFEGKQETYVFGMKELIEAVLAYRANAGKKGSD